MVKKRNKIWWEFLKCPACKMRIKNIFGQINRNNIISYMEWNNDCERRGWCWEVGGERGWTLIANQLVGPWQFGETLPDPDNSNFGLIGACFSRPSLKDVSISKCHLLLASSILAKTFDAYSGMWCKILEIVGYLYYIFI